MLRPLLSILPVAAFLCAAVCSSSPTWADDSANDQFHIEYQPVCIATAILTKHIHWNNFTPNHWRFFVPRANELGSQRNITEKLEIEGQNDVVSVPYQELSPAHAHLLCADFDSLGSMSNGDITAVATIKATLYSQQLLPGPPKTAVTLLSDQDKSINLMQTDTLNFTDPVFQNFLVLHHLNRLPGERDLFFARRVFDWVRTNYTYQYVADQKREASSICTTNWSDCGGLSNLFVTILRAGGVPATTILGHMAQTGNASNYNENHVKSIFYASKIGWVPVDMSYGTSDKDMSDYSYFGHDDGNFVALTTCGDALVDWGYGGVKPVTMGQQIVFWVHGYGTFTNPPDDSTWTVTYAPAESATH